MNMKDADIEQAGKSVESNYQNKRIPKGKDNWDKKIYLAPSCAPVACRLLKKRKLKILHDKELRVDPWERAWSMIKVSKLIFSFLRWVFSFLQSIARFSPLRFTPLTPVTKLSLGKLSWNKLIHCLNHLVYFSFDLLYSKEDFIPHLMTISMILEHYRKPYCFKECF